MNYQEFWNLQVKPLWNAYKSGVKCNTDTAEKYFVDVLKLIISLSTGLLAFMVVLQDKILKSILITDMQFLLFGFMLAIIFAICTFVLLAINYKKYADNDDKSLKELYKNLKDLKYDKIKQKIQKNEEAFLKSSDGGWQKSTIVFGIISFFLFLCSTFYLIHILIQSGLNR